eukprot:scaffold34000_cov69-Phaeocystis_antarctica.AAC.3
MDREIDIVGGASTSGTLGLPDPAPTPHSCHQTQERGPHLPGDRPPHALPALARWHGATCTRRRRPCRRRPGRRGRPPRAARRGLHQDAGRGDGPDSDDDPARDATAGQGD